jgi:hypothetical protein
VSKPEVPIAEAAASISAASMAIAHPQQPITGGGTMAATKKTKRKAAKKQKKGAANTRDMKELVDLSPEAVKTLNKPREKFEDHVEPLFQLYVTHQEKLGTLATGIDEGREQLARYTDLAPEEASARAEAEAANKRLELVTDTRALQASKVWGVMLDIYGKAKQAAKTDAAIAAEIKPFATFMAVGPRKKNNGG